MVGSSLVLADMSCKNSNDHKINAKSLFCNSFFGFLVIIWIFFQFTIMEALENSAVLIENRV